MFALAALLIAQLLLTANAAAPSIESRLQQLEDREQIRQLIIDYGRMLDRRDFQGYSRLFADDGEWIGGFGTAKGPAGILQMLERNMGQSTGPVAPRTHHLFTNETIEIDGDRARAQSRWAFISGGRENQPTVVMLGTYRDEFIRQRGEWKFLRREAITDLPVQDALQPRPGQEAGSGQ